MMTKCIKSHILFLSFAIFILGGCKFSSDNSTVEESDYSTKIIGSWEGTVGEVREVMVLKPDSTFVCHLHSIGFIANTLSQSLPGTINGKWYLKDSKIYMQITGEKNENVVNTNVSSLIVGFKQNSMLLKSGVGDSALFNRLLN